jgi:hypothetical protein
MQILVRNEISDVFDEIDQTLEPHILTLLEAADFNDYPPVSFSLENSTAVNVDDSSVIEYLHTRKIDTDNILITSSLLVSGFIRTMHGYSNKLAELLSE